MQSCLLGIHPGAELESDSISYTASANLGPPRRRCQSEIRCVRDWQGAIPVKDKGDREQEQAWRASRSSQSRSDHYESSAVSSRLTGSKQGRSSPYLVALPGTVMGWEQPETAWSQLESMASAWVLWSIQRCSQPLEATGQLASLQQTLLKGDWLVYHQGHHTTKQSSKGAVRI